MGPERIRTEVIGSLLRPEALKRARARSEAGELDPAIGGPAIPPAQQDASRRRSVYFFQSHNEHHKFLSIFDDASVLECYRRSESLVPQQALALTNSDFAVARSRS